MERMVMVVGNERKGDLGSKIVSGRQVSQGLSSSLILDLWC